MPMNPGLYEVDGVRRFGSDSFGDAQIQKAIDSALSRVDPDAKAVIFDVDLDGDGVRAVAAFQTGKGFSIGVIGEIDQYKNKSLGVRLTKVWK